MSSDAGNDVSDWFSEWPRREGFYFVQGHLWMSGPVEMRVCQVRPTRDGWLYACGSALLYPSEQPEDLLWWGPIPEPPPLPREAKLYGVRGSQEGGGA